MLKTVSSISSIHNGLELWIDTNKLNVVYCEYKIGEISAFFRRASFYDFFRGGPENQRLRFAE